MCQHKFNLILQHLCNLPCLELQIQKHMTCASTAVVDFAIPMQTTSIGTANSKTQPWLIFLNLQYQML